MTRKYTFGDRTINIHYLEERFLQEVIEGGEYEEAFKDLVIIDAGCNIGAFSFSVINVAKKIYAIDPSIQNIELLNETIKENNIENIETFCLGLSSKGGHRPFATDDRPGLGGWKISDQGERLFTQSIEEFIDANQIKVVDLLKIDIEGAEKEIFQSQAFRNVCSRIHKIVGEYHAYDPKEDLERLGFLYTTYQTKDGHTRFIAKKI